MTKAPALMIKIIKATIMGMVRRTPKKMTITEYMVEVMATIKAPMAAGIPITAWAPK